MATYAESFTRVNDRTTIGPNFTVDGDLSINGGPNSPAFYLEVNGTGVSLTEPEMRELFSGFLKAHDYYTEHGVSFEPFDAF